MNPREMRRRVLAMTRIEIVVWSVVIAVCVGLLLGGNRTPELLGLLILAPLILGGHIWVRSWFK